MLSWYTIRRPHGKHPCCPASMANMLLNPSLELIFSRLFMTFTLLTLQESSTTCKNSTVSTSLGNFQRKNWINNIVSVFHFPFLFSRKEIIISVVHWTFPSAHTAAMCPANWIWYCYLRQSSNQPLSLIREAIEKRFNCGFCLKPKFQLFWLVSRRFWSKFQKL